MARRGVQEILLWNEGGSCEDETTSEATSCAQLCRHLNIRKHSFHLTGTCSNSGGRLQSVGWHESSCHGYHIIHGLAAFFQLLRAWLTCLHSPSTMMGSCRQPKNGKQTHWAAKKASKTFYGYLQGWVANCTQYIFFSEMSIAVIMLVLDMEALQLVHR